MKKYFILAFMAIVACSGKPGPKDVVFDFIDGVLTSDSVKIVNDLDIVSFTKYLMVKMSPEDSAKVLADKPGEIINSMLKDGETRSRWMRQQIIVNTETIKKDTSEVEVSFMDKSTGHLLVTKMQLAKQPDGTWRIFYFVR